jgi:hypothetical protein
MVSHKMVYEKRAGQEDSTILYWKLHGEFAQRIDSIWLAALGGKANLTGWQWLFLVGK